MRSGKKHRASKHIGPADQYLIWGVQTLRKVNGLRPSSFFVGSSHGDIFVGAHGGRGSVLLDGQWTIFNVDKIFSTVRTG